jgi:hypothetical protein
MAKCCAEDKAEIYHCTKFEMTFYLEGLKEYFDIWQKRMIDCGTRCLKISFIGPGIKIVKRRKGCCYRRQPSVMSD